MLAKNGKAHTYTLEGPFLSSRDLHIQVVPTGRPSADIDKKDPAPDPCFIVPECGDQLARERIYFLVLPYQEKISREVFFPVGEKGL